MKCAGARVVCTDLDDPNRIRSIAESMQRNWKEIQYIPHLEETVKNNGPLAKACPFRWGNSSEHVAKCLNYDDDGTAKFDLICATDCLFMPWLHYELLKAVEELLAEDGVCIMAFAIHESFSKDEEVWPFVEKATLRSFRVEVLDAVQLTPPRKGMPAKQGLINILRLSRQDAKEG
jgi:predicted nicotinamide N-methyase